MIKLSGSIARKRKNVERRREAAMLSSHAWYLAKSAESGFRSFKTGDYSNEIMGLASSAMLGCGKPPSANAHAAVVDKGRMRRGEAKQFNTSVLGNLAAEGMRARQAAWNRQHKR
jgi:hypothetical protein